MIQLGLLKVDVTGGGGTKKKVDVTKIDTKIHKQDQFTTAVRKNKHYFFLISILKTFYLHLSPHALIWFLYQKPHNNYPASR